MSEPNEDSKAFKTLRTWLISVLLIAAAIAAVYIINSTEPKAERETATLRRAMLVEVMEAQRDNYRPIIVETGTVAPAREIQLAPQVGGRIIDLHPEFIPGGFIKAGEVILQIEKDDYEIRLAERNSELIEAESALAIEMGRQQVAQRDFELLGERLPEGKNTLVLREPQLAAAKTRVDAVKAAVKQAKLDLERTAVKSPFDAQILNRMADLGSQVSAGMPVAEIIGIKQYWIIATVSPSKLPFITFPEGDEVGSEVTLVKRGGSGMGGERKARLFRLIGELESNTRLARVVVEVDDPLSVNQDSENLPPLLIGEFLEVRIEGKILENVTRLPLDYLRKDDTTWIMSAEGKLEVRKLSIRFKDSSYAYVEAGIEDGERIITSNLSRVTEGAELRVEGERSQANE
ncbi:MAG: efflux RND transporter periplasmic adaptor subunit [Opitutales bacterium]